MNLFGKIILSLFLISLSLPGMTQEPYNVLFIAVDDLNDYVEFLGGHPQAITPNFNRLAEQSVIFTNAQCPAPKCAPSRNALLSGVPPHEEYVPVPLSFRDVPSIADRTSLPQHFKENGYKTMSIGKVFHAWGGEAADIEYSWTHLQELMGDRTGYVNSGASAISIDNSSLYDNSCMNENNYPIPALGPLDIPTSEYVETKTAEWVATRLCDYYVNPIFLSVGFFKPHIPYYLPAEWYDLYQDSILQYNTNFSDLDDIPSYGQQYLYHNLFDKYEECQIMDDIVKGYLACVSYVDHCLGIILDALESCPNNENTIVVLWSDHGHHLGEKKHTSKNTLWEESARIPLLIKVPGHTAAGQIEEAPVNLMDLYPTLVELCNLPNTIETAGRSIVPLLDDERNTADYPSITTLDTFNHSIRTKDYRYTRYKDGSEEIYHHTNDQNEWNNLMGASIYQEVKQHLSNQMEDILIGGNGLMNEWPRVFWETPSNNDLFVIGEGDQIAKIPLKVNAFDADGSVSQVEFWANDSLIQTFTSPPYEMDWKTEIQGEIILKAKVVDNQGYQIWSRANRIDVFYDTTSLQELDPINFTIYPNPVHQFLRISIYEGHGFPMNAVLYDMQGKKIQTWELNQNTNYLDMKQRFSDGTYFLKLQDKEGRINTKKLIIL